VERISLFSREAAREFSPQRKLWVKSGKRASPGRAEDWFSRTLFSRLCQPRLNKGAAEFRSNRAATGSSEAALSKAR